MSIFFYFSHTSYTYIFLNFYWGIVDLQCWASFKCTAKWICHTNTYIYSFLDSFPVWIITGYWVEFPVLNCRSLLVICWRIYIPIKIDVPLCLFNLGTPLSSTLLKWSYLIGMFLLMAVVISLRAGNSLVGSSAANEVQPTFLSSHISLYMGYNPHFFQPYFWAPNLMALKLSSQDPKQWSCLIPGCFW